MNSALAFAGQIMTGRVDDGKFLSIPDKYRELVRTMRWVENSRESNAVTIVFRKAPAMRVSPDPRGFILIEEISGDLIGGPVATPEDAWELLLPWYYDATHPYQL